MARMVSLDAWAKEEFGEQAPSPRTLNLYAKSKMMVPPAVKVGRRWMIDREARFTGMLATPRLSPNASPLLKRIIEDGSQTKNA
ncbi:excisionase [Erwinia phyllosphaerae]|uniref:excisionase n=1 Tax=Erwinia phyllosphaerae TaxID=2853256 RepID=UPI001FEEB4C0|nr:excisionase [Erwinia phyllosphaerae]MBV4366247.1 excisionase [Erwinia phyllosphaerae]